MSLVGIKKKAGTGLIIQPGCNVTVVAVGFWLVEDGADNRIIDIATVSQFPRKGFDIIGDLFGRPDILLDLINGS